MRPHTELRTIALLALVITLAVSACGGDGSVDATEPATADADAATTTDADAVADADAIDPDDAQPTPALTEAQIAEAVTGLTVADAEAWAAEQGFEVRVVVIDGVDQVVTDDLIEDRINVSVVDGVVTGVDGLY
ncbi:MAG: hypothetical protein AAGD35_10965 [Actinomycetota bacterium]